MLLKHEGEGAIAMSDADTMPDQPSFEEAHQRVIEALKAQKSLEDTATNAKQSLEATMTSMCCTYRATYILLIKHEELQVELQGVKNELARANEEIEKLRKRKACNVVGNGEEPGKTSPVTPTSPHWFIT